MFAEALAVFEACRAIEADSLGLQDPGFKFPGAAFACPSFRLQGLDQRPPRPSSRNMPCRLLAAVLNESRRGTVIQVTIEFVQALDRECGGLIRCLAHAKPVARRWPVTVGVQASEIAVLAPADRVPVIDVLR